MHFGQIGLAEAMAELVLIVAEPLALVWFWMQIKETIDL